MKARGNGSIYKRGGTWWVKYYAGGRPIRESARSASETQARKLLRRRLAELETGTHIGPQADRLTFEDLAADLITDYRINGKQVSNAKLHVRHLAEHFAGWRAKNITADAVRRYIAARQERGFCNATINRDLAALRRMFSLAIQAGKIAKRPHIPKLEEHNVRKGFFERDEFERLRANLPRYLRPFVTFGYYTGWRVSEIRDLKWRQVHLTCQGDKPVRGAVRLDAGTTKSGEGRVIYLEPELLAQIGNLYRNRRLNSPYVFTRDGRRIGEFRKSWKRACAAAGIPNRLFHDFRRTAVRNMVRAGIPERVAMMMSGHKTRSVFDRYHIVSDRDLEEAAARLGAFRLLENGHNLGTIAPFGAATTPPRAS